MSRLAWAQKFRFRRSSLTRGAALVGLLGWACGAMAAPVDRTLNVSIAVDGQQDWKNALQWSKATTTQSYTFSTTLRSDGKLYAANLLEPETDLRMAIKTEYLRQQGAAKLKTMGIDPKSPTLMQDLSRRAQKANFDCKGEAVCMGNTNNLFAELMAAAVEPDNSQLFEGPPRYQFFFGYPGCSNTLRSVVKYDAAGETGYGRNKDKIYPYALKYDGDYAGKPVDQASMCNYFTVVYDSVDKKIFVENTYIPQSRGTVTRTEFGKSTTTEAELPMPAPLQGWVNENLRHAALSGEAKGVLPLTLPLDGNATVLGAFTGEAKATLKWSWSEPGAAAPAKK